MDPQLFGLLEPIVILSFLGALTYGAKVMIWGKGPVRKLKSSDDTEALKQRIAELEDLLEQQHLEVLDRHADLEERLEFAERMLTQNRAKELEAPSESQVSTPE
jgi:hypothetical protein